MERNFMPEHDKQLLRKNLMGRRAPEWTMGKGAP
jgi:hypothetical protein